MADANLDPIPGYYQDPGLSANRDYISQGLGEHIDPFTGKLQFHFVDLFLPGNGGLNIKVQRSYSSGDGFLRDPAPLGLGWTMSFGRVIRKATVNICDNIQAPPLNPVLELPDGSRQILYVGDGTVGAVGQFVTTDLWVASCASSSPTSGLIVHSPDGTEYDMTTMGPAVGPTPTNQQKAWYVSKIIDRNGNSLSFGYQTFAQYLAVSSITASDGRLVTLSYNANGTLKSVTDGTRTVTYSSHGVPNAPTYFYLDSVTLADGVTKWSYAYNESVDGSAGAGSIRQASFPGGGSYTYAYQLVTFNANLPATQVIGSKKGDGGTWTFGYKPATTILQDATATGGCNNTAFDVTTVTGPDGTRLYCHVGYNSIGVTKNGGSFIYAIGALTGTEVGPGQGDGGADVEMDSPGFTAQVITRAQNLVRPGDAFPVAQPVSFVQSTGHAVTRDGASYTTTLSGFDQYGNAALVTETGPRGDSRATTIGYYIDPTKWILHQRASEAPVVNNVALGTISRKFDPNANMLSETKSGVKTAWTYDTQGNIATKTDALNNVFNYKNYKLGIPQLENFPEGQTLKRVVDTVGNVTSMTDGENATTTYTYDGMSRIKTIVHPLASSNPVNVAWSPTSRVLTRGGFTETITYDGYGREVKRVAGGGSQSVSQTFQYDSVGRRVFSSDPSSAAGTRTVYDILARPVQTFKACASSTDGTCAAHNSILYKPAREEVTDELGATTINFYRGFGDPGALELMSVEAPAGTNATMNLTRNGLGQVLTVAQGAFTRTYGYNANFFLTSIINPETGTTTIGRDALGNMTSRQVGTSPATTFAYDGLNRLKTTTYPAGTPNVTRTYYLDSQPKLVDNGVSQRNYSYDANKNLTQETLTFTGRTFTTQYSFNTNDALATLTYDSGRTITYSPDAFGRSTQASPYVTALSYFPNSTISSMTTANGVVTTYTQNARLWPDTMKSSLGSVQLLSSKFGYDDAGNMLTAADAVDATQNRTLSYDPIGRLSTVKAPWGNGTITYDGTGNILQQKFDTFALGYTYDTTKNVLNSVSGSKLQTYAYDVYGDVTGNGSTAFTYNDAQHMTCANCGTANEVDYQYDGDGMRLSATPKSGLPTYFVYGQGGHLMMETSPTKSLKEYVYVSGKQVAVAETSVNTSLSLSASASVTTAAVNDLVTFNLAVKNNGTSDAADVSIVDTLPTQMALVSASPQCTPAGGGVTCALGGLAASATSNITIVARALQAGSQFNVGAVTSSTPNSTAQNASAVTSLVVR